MRTFRPRPTWPTRARDRAGWRYALLFLEPAAGGAWTLLRGGIRLCTDDGRTLVPTGEGRCWTSTRPPAGRCSSAVSAMTWRRLTSCTAISGSAGQDDRRRRALGWVRGGGEFTASTGGSDEAPGRQDRLHHEVFDWIFAAAGPDDAERPSPCTPS
ncbi:MAG: hypothetical protein U0736_00770 [Gemmataceae bacterium]